MNIDDLRGLNELTAVDKLLAEAATSTDKGDYRNALIGFEHALEMTQKIFGENTELTDLKFKIADIYELLKKQDM